MNPARRPDLARRAAGVLTGLAALGQPFVPAWPAQTQAMKQAAQERAKTHLVHRSMLAGSGAGQRRGPPTVASIRSMTRHHTEAFRKM